MPRTPSVNGDVDQGVDALAGRGAHISCHLEAGGVVRGIEEVAGRIADCGDSLDISTIEQYSPRNKNTKTIPRYDC
jgi:hypothetical protein